MHDVEQRRPHVVIAGGTGFVGRALAAHLPLAGWRVSVLSRRRASVHQVFDERVEALEYDDLPVACDALVNLAGANLFDRRWNAAYKELLQTSRVATTQRLVDAYRTATQRPAVLIQTSAVGYYGDHGAETIDEDTAPDEHDFLSRLCVCWEAAANTATELGMRVVILRFGLVLGRDGGALQRLESIFRKGLGGKLAGGRQFMPWIHVTDLARQVEWALSRPSSSGPYDATAPLPCTNAELSVQLARALHRPCLFPVPAMALRIVLGEAARYMIASQRVVPKRALAEGFDFRFPDLQSALADLYPPRAAR